MVNPPLNSKIMIKVKFLKDHSVYKTGDNTELDDALGNYLLRCGVVEAAAQKKEGKTAAKRETKEHKTKPKTK